MTMIGLQDLEDWFSDLRDLILDTHICINNGKRIAQDKYENEKKLKKVGFFYHYQLQQAFIVAIQLCKILSDSNNQKRNVHKLFAVIESQNFADELGKRLNNEKGYLFKSRDELIIEINRLRKLVNEKNELINRVQDVRDKAYAHYDSDRKQFGPSFLDYQELANLSEEIYNSLYLRLFGSTMLFQHTVPWEIDPIIRRAAKEYTDMINGRHS